MPYAICHISYEIWHMAYEICAERISNAIALGLPVLYRGSILSSIMNHLSTALAPLVFDQRGAFGVVRIYADQDAAFSDLLLEFMSLLFRNARSVKRAERSADQPARAGQ